MTDTDLLSRFEALALAPGEFRHRQHVQLAFAMLDRYRIGLRRFAEHCGAAGKYRDDLTCAWLALVATRLAMGPYASFDALVDAHPDLLDKTVIPTR